MRNCNRSVDEHRSDRRKTVRIQRTSLGLGVFSGRRYQAEEIVGEVTGDVIDDWDYSSSYCMDLGDSRSLEPATPFRFVNHSCEPNCFIDWFDLRSEGGAAPQRRMFLIAGAAIRAGVELTIDYAWPAWAAVRCRCHARHCRGWIVAEDQLHSFLASEAATV